MSGCSHRWVTMVVMAEENGETDYEIVAHESCDAILEYASQREKEPNVIGIDAMNTRMKHFHRWIAKTDEQS